MKSYKIPKQTITKANPYRTGTTPIKWLPHSSANCTWTVTLYWPLHRPMVPMVVNTGLLVLCTTKLLWYLKKSLHTKASHNCTLLSQFPDIANSSSDCVEGLQAGCHGLGAQTSWDHEGWQLASETGHYFYWKQKPHSQNTMYYCYKKKNSNPMAPFCFEKVEGRLTEIAYQAYLAQKVLIFTGLSALFPSAWWDRIALILSAHMAAVLLREPVCGHGEAEATADIWLVAKPAAQAQGKPQPVPGVRQGFPLQRLPTSVFSLNGHGVISMQDAPTPCSTSELPIDSIDLGTVCRENSRQPNP